jgi:large subunit ribosomal protein L5
MYLKEKYLSEIAPAIKKESWLQNVMEIPKIEKIVLNMWIWTYIRTWNKDYSSLKQDMALISGQQPVVKLAKKAVSNFKLRAWMPVWLTVTLRGENMYAFLEKLINVVLPRVKDFRWISKRSFDAEGNYNFWIKEHTIFPEVPQLDVVKPHWLQITIKTNVNNRQASVMLLEKMGFPFSK